MSKGRNKRNKNGQLPIGIFRQNPYYVGAIPTPKAVRALRRESKRIAKEIISFWRGR